MRSGIRSAARSRRRGRPACRPFATPGERVATPCGKRLAPAWRRARPSARRCATRSGAIGASAGGGCSGPPYNGGVRALVLALLIAAHARAVELHIQFGALERMLAEQVFTEEGRRYVRG